MTGPDGAAGAGAVATAEAVGARLVLVQAARTDAAKATLERTFTRIPSILVIRRPRLQGFFEKPLHIGLEGLP